MPSTNLSKWLTIIALLIGATASSALMTFVGGGWIPSAFGYVAWALMPYAVLLAIYFASGLFRVYPTIRRMLARVIMIVALAGPLFYVDTLFIHVDAQGALAILMFPIIQTGFGLFAIVVSFIWRWRIHRTTT